MADSSTNIQTETLILIVYAIIEVIGIIGNVYVVCWSICGSKKGCGLASDVVFTDNR